MPIAPDHLSTNEFMGLLIERLEGPDDKVRLEYLLEDRPVWLSPRLVDEPDRLLVTSYRTPWWFAITVLSVPVGLYIHWLQTHGYFSPVTGETALHLVLTTGAVLLIIAVFFGIDYAERRKGPLLLLDKTRRILRLPRLELEVPLDSVLAYTVVAGLAGTAGGRVRLAELNAVVRTSDHAVYRVSVLTSVVMTTVHRIGEALSSCCSVPLKEMNAQVARPARTGLQNLGNKSPAGNAGQ